MTRRAEEDEERRRGEERQRCERGDPMRTAMLNDEHGEDERNVEGD